MGTTFVEKYPSIARWLRHGGQIEIGQDEETDTFVRAIKNKVVSWKGQADYRTIDEALRDMETALGKISKDSKRSSAKPRKPNSHATDGERKASKRDRRSRKESGKHAALPSEQQKVIKQVQKLEKLIDELREGGHFSITRLTVIKGLCGDPTAAGQFALFLSRKVQRTMREKGGPKRYRELINRAVREMKPYLDDPSDERRNQLWALFREVEAEQNEYRSISWGAVRNIKSWELLVIEKALQVVLRPHEAPFWSYEVAKDYAVSRDHRCSQWLVRSSAGIVEEMAEFWRKRFIIRR